LGNWKCPVLSVVAVLEYLLTGFCMETVAPGTTAPDGSVTVPPTEPEFDCAYRSEKTTALKKTRRKEKMLRADPRMESLLESADCLLAVLAVSSEIRRGSVPVAAREEILAVGRFH
jgi:hypothetical protein